MTMHDKVNIKESSTDKELADGVIKKTSGTSFSSRGNVKVMVKRIILIDYSGPATIMTTDVVTCTKIAQGSLKVLEQRDKMLQKFAETRLLKRPESIYSPITRKNNNNTGTIIKKLTTSNISSKRRYSNHRVAGSTKLLKRKGLFGIQ